jgi:hypothetical protein
MTMTRIAPLCLFAAMCFTKAFCQLPAPVSDHINKMMPKPVPASPNVAALGKYGDYEVSHQTGIPSIDIPLYEIQSGDLKLPISLSYHASGIKPTDVASWVGTGWSLSTGGQVSRSISGRPDEEGFLTSPLNTSATVCNNYYYLVNAATGLSDTEPDGFSYSTDTQSGKFILRAGNTPLMFPYAPIKIKYDNALSNFEITEQDGKINRYGVSDITTPTNGGNPSYSARTSWLLTEMIAPNSDDVIALQYQTLGQFSTYDISYSYALADACDKASEASCPPNLFAPMMHELRSTGTQKGPSTIRFATGSVAFVAETLRKDQVQLKRLDRIEVRDLDSVLMKTIKFKYSYFTNANGDSIALKLNAIQFLDKNGVVVNDYKFEYFTNSFSWSNSMSFYNARDLWGYYNGATTNTDLILPRTEAYNATIATSTAYITFGGAANREVNPVYVKEGVLKKITFPTGGSTEFDFESNKYLYQSAPRLAGGLRVKKIVSKDKPNGPAIVKTYKYGYAESGYGIPNFSELQFNYNTFQHIKTGCNTYAEPPYVYYNIRTYQSMSAYESESSPVLYTYVTEYFGDPTGSTNGKIEYQYDNGTTYSDVNHVIPNSGKYYRNNFAWKRGKLTRKTVFDKSGNKLRKSQFTYGLFNSGWSYVGIGVHKYESDPLNYCGVNAGQLCINEANELVIANGLIFNLYQQDVGALMQTDITEIEFQNGDTTKYVAKGTSITFDPDKLQPLLVNTTHGSRSKYTVNKYAYQLESGVNASSTGNAEGIYLLNQKHILNEPIESYSYFYDGSAQKITEARVTSYARNSANPNQVKPQTIYLFESETPVDATSYNAISINSSNNGINIDSRLKPRIQFTSYNEQGDETSIAKLGDAPVSYLYGYNKSFPIAEVVNASNGQYESIQTGTASIALSGSTSGVIQQTYNFTVDFTGTVKLFLGVNGNPSYNTVATYQGLGTYNYVTVAKGGCNLTEVTFANVAPGAYSLTITLNTADTGVSSLSVCGQITFPKSTGVISGTSEIFYEGFEESVAANVVSTPLIAQNGKKYYSGDYTVSFVKPNNRNYTIEYWYYDNAISKWKPLSKVYTGSTMVLNEGTAIDNVRIRPTNAVITTYTYDPINGMTSATADNNMTTYYEYDDFGRLRFIKDHLGNIVSMYDYHYKGN